MVKIFYKKDIIGDKALNPITEKNKIRRFMKKAGYEPSANLSEICSYYPYWFNCNIIILAERLKLVPWMNNAKVITDNHETWWHVPMEAYNFISAFNSWYKNNIDKNCLDISFYNWSIEKRTKLLNDFVKNINYLDDILNRDPNEDIIDIIKYEIKNFDKDTIDYDGLFDEVREKMPIFISDNTIVKSMRRYFSAEISAREAIKIKRF